MLDTIKISQIDMTSQKHKRPLDPTKVTALAESIKAHGLMNPITLAGNKLIAGRHRVAAYKELGLSDIPHIRMGDINNPAELEMMEIAENLLRAELTAEQRTKQERRYIKLKVQLLGEFDKIVAQTATKKVITELAQTTGRNVAKALQGHSQLERLIDAGVSENDAVMLSNPEKAVVLATLNNSPSKKVEVISGVGEFAGKVRDHLGNKGNKPYINAFIGVKELNDMKRSLSRPMEILKVVQSDFYRNQVSETEFAEFEANIHKIKDFLDKLELPKEAQL